MNKIEFYNKIVDLYNKTGQGTPLFVGAKIGMSIVDELIEDGLVKIVTHQYSYLPNDETICLTKGYCVEDDVHENVLALNCIRFYLNFDPVVELGKVATVTLKECIQNFEFMEKYVEWFKKNKEKLDEIKDIEYLEESELNDETIEFLKDKVWYEKNKTVSQCIKIIDESAELCKKSLSLYKELITLMGKDDSFKSELNVHIENRKITEKDLKFYNRLKNWLETKDSKSKIQSFF